MQDNRSISARTRFSQWQIASLSPVADLDASWTFRGDIPDTPQGGRKSLGTNHQKFFYRYIDFLRMAFIDKMFGYKILDLLKKNNFYIEYFFIKVVVIKAQRVEKRDCFLCSVAYPWILRPANPWDSRVDSRARGSIISCERSLPLCTLVRSWLADGRWSWRCGWLWLGRRFWRRYW